MTKLHREYEAFLKEQTHVKASTLNLMRIKLSIFPTPAKLSGDWFRDRMKEVSPSTIKTEVVLAKRFLKWAGRDTSELERDRLKLPRIKDAVTVEDLYTKKEIAAIFKACLNTRDRALLEVLYETGARAGEVLSMKWEGVSFGKSDNLTSIFVTGKTDTRKTYIKAGAPSLKAWLEVHPTGKGPIWCRLRPPHTVIIPRHLYGIVEHALARAGIKNKTRIVHLFRHTRVSELINRGIHGQQLNRIMGWTKKSNMEATYAHLSTEDVENDLNNKMYDGETEREKPKPLLESMVCPRCKSKNKQDARICSKCNMPLSNDAIMQALQQQEEMEKEIEQMVQERVDESMDRVVQAFTAAIQDIKDTKTLKDLAVVFAKKMKEESASIDSE